MVANVARVVEQFSRRPSGLGVGSANFTVFDDLKFAIDPAYDSYCLVGADFLDNFVACN